MGEKEELRKEITEIMGHVKRLIIAHKDSGFEGPDITRVISDLFQKDPLAAVSIEELRILIKDCTRCELHKNRNHVVFGEGAPDARIMFIGEGPGREEDIEGRPFVGEAGRLLTKIIENGIGVKRSQVYISNVVKCRPPRNRDPQPQEIKTCLPFLEKQIRLIRPQVICTLGRIAFRALIKKDGPMQDHRGKWYYWEDIPVMPTYHPAYIIRNPAIEKRLKAMVWKDIKEIMRCLGMEV